MKIIGFADYFISEWHADNYPAWIKQVNEEMGEDFEFKYVWADVDVSPHGVTTDDWCAKMGVEKVSSLQELCEKCDYVLVLSPSNPEKHLEYAKVVLSYGKNTYIDKTFAPDYAEAKQIFDVGESYNTKFFSTSALRYATELNAVEKGSKIDTYGGGSNVDEYIIHQIEMLIKATDGKGKKVKVEQNGNQYICTVLLSDGNISTMNFAPSFGFEVVEQKANGETVKRGIQSDFFKGLIKDILQFFISGKTSFDTNQTLEIMKIREAVIKGKDCLGQWIEL